MLEAKKVSKSYNRRNLVLDNISFFVSENEVCCLLGKNGSGKSTILNMFAQIIMPDSGIMIINGFELTKRTPLIDQGIGVLSQFDNLIDQISGYQFLKFQCLLFNISDQESERRIKTLVEYFFDDFVDVLKSISGYSSGMRMKLRIIATLIHRPKLLILDEPFSHLDPFSSEKLVLLLTQFSKGNGHAILVSSHDLLYVQKIATKICVLNNKNIVFDGTLNDFTKDRSGQIDKTLFAMVNEKQLSSENISWLW